MNIEKYELIKIIFNKKKDSVSLIFEEFGTHNKYNIKQDFYDFEGIAESIESTINSAKRKLKNDK